MMDDGDDYVVEMAVNADQNEKITVALFGHKFWLSSFGPKY